MKSIILLLALAVTAQAAEKEPKCYTKTITVCPVKKHKKPPIAIPLPLIEYREKKVFVPVAVVAPCVDALCPDKPFIVGGHLAIGLGVRDPYVSGMAGIRLHIPKAHLGLEVFSAFQYGVGAQLLIYPYQGRRVNLHIIDPGFLITGSPFDQFGEKDIARRVDLLLGLGVEVKIICHLSLTADWRVGIPDPGKIARDDSCGPNCSRRIDAGATIGNAFASSQIFLGVLVHN